LPCRPMPRTKHNSRICAGGDVRGTIEDGTCAKRRWSSRAVVVRASVTDGLQVVLPKTAPDFSALLFPSFFSPQPDKPIPSVSPPCPPTHLPSTPSDLPATITFVSRNHILTSSSPVCYKDIQAIKCQYLPLISLLPTMLLAVPRLRHRPSDPSLLT